MCLNAVRHVLNLGSSTSTINLYTDVSNIEREGKCCLVQCEVVG